jgi:hypothetical protein
MTSPLLPLYVWDPFSNAHSNVCPRHRPTMPSRSHTARFSGLIAFPENPLPRTDHQNLPRHPSITPEIASHSRQSPSRSTIDFR